MLPYALAMSAASFHLCRVAFAATAALVAPCQAGDGAVDLARSIAVDARSDAAGIPYRAFVHRLRPDVPAPLIVYLAGSGQVGDDNVSQLAGRAQGALRLFDEAERRGIDLVFVAPQAPTDYWKPADVLAVVDDVQARFGTSPRRVILTGVSSGATGVWDALKARPDRFAAAVPMSGMTETAGLAAIRDVPEWVFHAADDNDTDVEKGYGGAMVGSRAVVRALRAAGGRPCYTEYVHGPRPATHVIWPRAYATPGLLDWMLRQRRGMPPQGRCPCSLRNGQVPEQNACPDQGPGGGPAPDMPDAASDPSSSGEGGVLQSNPSAKSTRASASLAALSALRSSTTPGGAETAADSTIGRSSEVSLAVASMWNSTASSPEVPRSTASSRAPLPEACVQAALPRATQCHCRFDSPSTFGVTTRAPATASGPALRTTTS